MVAGKEDRSSFQLQPGGAAGWDNALGAAPLCCWVPWDRWDSSCCFPSLSWPCHPSCHAREPGIWVPLSHFLSFHPYVGVWKVLSSLLQPHLQGVVLQCWQSSLHSGDSPSPALCSAAGWVKSFSLSLIPKLHHGCNSIDLSASPSMTL